MALLDDKSIVVIGGTTGIGLSAAKAFVAQGARVVVAGRNPESLDKALLTLGEAARGIAADAREPESAERAIDLAIAKFGNFDGLYHVAGGSGRRMGDGPLHEITDEGWDATLDLNLKSLMLSNRAAIRRFIERKGGGAILNMSSVLAWSPSVPHFATHAYAAAKAGAIGFSKSIAAFYAAHNIRVNVLAPALVETSMARRAAEDPAIRRFVKAKQPLDGGRIGRPEDLDAAAVFLMSDGAKFCTGQVLSVDGGWCVSDACGASGQEAVDRN